jgi:hypothetical protein
MIVDLDDYRKFCDMGRKKWVELVSTKKKQNNNQSKQNSNCSA